MIVPAHRLLSLTAPYSFQLATQLRCQRLLPWPKKKFTTMLMIRLLHLRFSRRISSNRRERRCKCQGPPLARFRLRWLICQRPRSSHRLSRVRVRSSRRSLQGRDRSRPLSLYLTQRHRCEGSPHCLLMLLRQLETFLHCHRHRYRTLTLSRIVLLSAPALLPLLSAQGSPICLR